MSMLIRELKLQGMLSFGPESPSLEMEPLNVLIGPNGSGKSNLIEAIDLLRSSATRLTAPMRGRGGGGVTEWIWKGAPDGVAELEAVVRGGPFPSALRHKMMFGAPSGRFTLANETIEDAEPGPPDGRKTKYFHHEMFTPILTLSDGSQRKLERGDIADDESILSQRNDPDQYPQLNVLAKLYGRIAIYREWSFGRSSVFRTPQAADLPSDRLAEDFSNLGLFLNSLRSIPKAKNEIIERLKDLYEGLDDFDVRVKGGTVEVFLTEGDFVIPAGRLSDGTLRYLCLLAILCDREPPSLICIEEPELGLHPDILPKLADLLVAASERTQLVVTTHSDILVDALSERPESVVVVEKHDGQTTMRRLKAEDLTVWLKDYRLGQLWTRGDIGGTRW